MGIFGGKHRVKGKSPATTLIAEGCTIVGQIQVENQLQIDGHVEGEIDAETQVKISKTGYVLGEITTDHLIINGYFEGVCRAEHIEILSSGSVNGEVYSDNLSIEAGGKFMGLTNPSDNKPNKTLSHQEDQEDLEETNNINLIGNNEPTM